MIDHIILTVSDFERSVAFYAKALKPLGITNFTDYEGQDGHPDLKGFGDGKRAFFWLKEGKPDPQAVHVGFVAKDHAEVDAFYNAAVDAGGKSKEAPFPAPLSPPAARFLRCAPDRFSLTKTNSSCTIEMPASLRSENCSPSARNAVRVPFGIRFAFAGILTIARAGQFLEWAELLLGPAGSVEV